MFGVTLVMGVLVPVLHATEQDVNLAILRVRLVMGVLAAAKRPVIYAREAATLASLA
jgi:hypothetical protein